MLRLAKFFTSLALILIIMWLGLLNTQPVKLVTLPPTFVSDGFGIYTVPLFVIVIVSAFWGFIMGCTAEYLRASKTRKCLKERNSDLKKSDTRLKSIEKDLDLEDDEILSLLK